MESTYRPRSVSSLLIRFNAILTLVVCRVVGNRVWVELYDRRRESEEVEVGIWSGRLKSALALIPDWKYTTNMNTTADNRTYR